MQAENILAKNISAAGRKSSYDAACKRLLANKIILAWIMKSCLVEYKDCDVKEIAECYIEGEPQISSITVNPDESSNTEQITGMATEDATIAEGTITYDIRFFATFLSSINQIRLFINLEAQNDFYPGYPIIKRGLYYCSRMISSQYGTEFSSSQYDKIKKVYSIWICMNPPENRRNTITRYSIHEENIVGNVHEIPQNYDLLSAIIICLSDSEQEADGGVLKLLEVLLSPTREAAEKKQILQNDFHIEMTRKLEKEVSIMCNLSKGIEEIGIREGKREGKKEGILFSIQSLMETMDFTMEEAMNALKIPKTEQEQYTKKLKQK